ncbi:hypothetical protein SNEBB_002385 [Seison nebaliae]|nr:hypothetical protein SNEBB_002385 [Seison nebaliae]
MIIQWPENSALLNIRGTLTSNSAFINHVLGFTLIDNDLTTNDNEAMTGVSVQTVRDKSIAAKQGLRQGDVLITLNGICIRRSRKSTIEKLIRRNKIIELDIKRTYFEISEIQFNQNLTSPNYLSISNDGRPSICRSSTFLSTNFHNTVNGGHMLNNNSNYQLLSNSQPQSNIYQSNNINNNNNSIKKKKKHLPNLSSLPSPSIYATSNIPYDGTRSNRTPGKELSRERKESNSHSFYTMEGKKIKLKSDKKYCTKSNRIYSNKDRTKPKKESTYQSMENSLRMLSAIHYDENDYSLNRTRRRRMKKEDKSKIMNEKMIIGKNRKNHDYCSINQFGINHTLDKTLLMSNSDENTINISGTKHSLEKSEQAEKLDNVYVDCCCPLDRLDKKKKLKKRRSSSASDDIGYITQSSKQCSPLLPVEMGDGRIDNEQISSLQTTKTMTKSKEIYSFSIKSKLNENIERKEVMNETEILSAKIDYQKRYSNHQCVCRSIEQTKNEITNSCEWCRIRTELCEIHHELIETLEKGISNYLRHQDLFNIFVNNQSNDRNKEFRLKQIIFQNIEDISKILYQMQIDIFSNDLCQYYHDKSDSSNCQKLKLNRSSYLKDLESIIISVCESFESYAEGLTDAFSTLRWYLFSSTMNVNRSQTTAMMLNRLADHINLTLEEFLTAPVKYFIKLCECYELMQVCPLNKFCHHRKESSRHMSTMTSINSMNSTNDLSMINCTIINQSMSLSKSQLDLVLDNTSSERKFPNIRKFSSTSSFASPVIKNGINNTLISRPSFNSMQQQQQQSSTEKRLMKIKNSRSCSLPKKLTENLNENRFVIDKYHFSLPLNCLVKNEELKNENIIYSSQIISNTSTKQFLFLLNNYYFIAIDVIPTNNENRSNKYFQIIGMPIKLSDIQSIDQIDSELSIHHPSSDISIICLSSEQAFIWKTVISHRIST